MSILFFSFVLLVAILMVVALDAVLMHSFWNAVNRPPAKPRDPFDPR